VYLLSTGEMRHDQFQAYLDRLCTSHRLKGCRRVLSRLSELSLGDRSALAKLCRAQCYPPRHTRLAKLTKRLPPDFRKDILPLCQTPLVAGLVLQLVHLAPMDEKSVDETYKQSMIKEMTVMESVKRECTVDFEPFFGDYNGTIHESIPSNPTVFRQIHAGIDRWISRLESRILYPKMSSKTVSKETARELWRTDQSYVQNSDIGITGIDLERMYHVSGVEISGPCEMRQKWYCSQLQPRTYYAQGGTAYRTSKYLAGPFVDLCDTLPATNRRTRVEPSRIVIRDPSYDVVYYDLTSFTSNMHTQAAFCYRLAQYCVGRTVHLLDSHLGIIAADLGDLIYDYTRANLCDPEYTLPSKYSDPSTIHYHSVAGFLGVYGNIATATFIHGIVMASLHTYLDENNVAGDDGLDVTAKADTTLNAARLIGSVSDEKTFRESEGCCIHLKRPITRLGQRLIHGQLITWPSLEPVQHDVDPRYPYLKNLTNRKRKDMLAGSITAFLRKLQFLKLDEHDLELIDIVLSYLYDTYGLPREGCVPQVTRSNSGFVSAYEKRYIGMDPIYNTITRCYAGIVKLPLREYSKWEYGMLESQVFRCNSTKLLKHLTSLGYLEQEKVSRYVFGEEGLKELLKEYTHPDPAVYDYTVIRELPVWISDYSLLTLSSDIG